MSEPSEADARLLAAHDLARAALLEVTPAATVGDPAGYTLEPDGVVSLRFSNRMPGYPGWFWTVSVAAVEDADPTVLEVELLPGDGALLAPEWVPWATRLAEYQAAQTAQDEDEDDADEDDEDDEEGEGADTDDLEDLDAADFDTDGSPILHAGDVDGVDIDELDETATDADDEDADGDPEATDAEDETADPAPDDAPFDDADSADGEETDDVDAPEILREY